MHQHGVDPYTHQHHPEDSAPPDQYPSFPSGKPQDGKNSSNAYPIQKQPRNHPPRLHKAHSMKTDPVSGNAAPYPAGRKRMYVHFLIQSSSVQCNRRQDIPCLFIRQIKKTGKKDFSLLPVCTFSVYTENRTYFLSFSIQSFNSFAAVSLPPTPKAMAPATQKAPRISAKAI